MIRSFTGDPMSQDSDGRPSKSAAKREAEALQDLGESLIDLPRAVLAGLPLPDDLRSAVELARKIRSNSGLRRQRQLIGKLMRRIDTEPIRAALEAREQTHRARVQIDHRAESWRDDLLEHGDAAIEHLVSQYPLADRQALRQLLRSATGPESPRTIRARRELFRSLRRMIEAAS